MPAILSVLRSIGGGRITRWLPLEPQGDVTRACYTAGMRHLAGAIVILAGAILWGAGACALAWAYMAKGNRWAADSATYGGMAVVVIGCLILFLAHSSTRE